MQVKNKLKIKLSAIMDPIKTRYKKFKKPIIDLALLYHILYPTPQLNIPQAYQKTNDDMILDVATGRKYYNMDLDVIEERLWNGYYCEPKQFLADVKMIHYDSLSSGDRERIVRSSEMLTNAQVYIDEISTDIQFVEDCKNVHKRELEERQRLSALIPDDKGVIDLSTNGNVNDALPNMQNTNTSEHVLAAASETVVDVATANLHPGGGEIAVSPPADEPETEALSVVIPSTVKNLEVSTADNTAIGIDINGIKGPDDEHASSVTAPVKSVEKHHPDLDSSETIYSETCVKSDAENCSTFPTSPKFTQLLAEAEKETIKDKNAAIVNHFSAVPTEEVSQVSNEPSSSLNGEADTVMKSESNIIDTADHQVIAPSLPASSGVTLVSKEEVEKEIEVVPGPELILDEDLVSKFKEKLVTLTDGLSVERLEQVNSMLIDLLWKQRHLWNRNTILELLDDKLTKVITLIKESDTKRKERLLKASAPF
ncbi:hypothetical protein D0Z00_002850 [Geotrichum galactomycetum]|uniref:Uncharacterized protein n=1 Tax=Geotrichum galactomycetum TaxID=27317 RepID=A0ACB6V315_9ASCO|nr:hypothetical protein D0Z00_002850 [Geotrichum candidum]